PARGGTGADVLLPEHQLRPEPEPVWVPVADHVHLLEPADAARPTDGPTVLPAEPDHPAVPEQRRLPRGRRAGAAQYELRPATTHARRHRCLQAVPARRAHRAAARPRG